MTAFSVSDNAYWSRRQLLAGLGGVLPLALLHSTNSAEQTASSSEVRTHFPPTARRIVFLQQSGGPSQADLFDNKPELRRRQGEELPPSVRRDQRLTTMTANQASKPLLGSPFKFSRHGRSGIELSELLPHIGKVADEITVIRTLQTDAINHDPAITFLQTGGEQPGRPSIGSWISYGLGSENRNLPDYVVFLSGGVPGDQPLYSRLWGAGFLPSAHQGVEFRGKGDPVLYLSNPPGITHTVRRRMMRSLRELHELQLETTADASIEARMRQQEMAFRMQSSVPELVKLSSEPEHTFELYGQDAKVPGTYAANCVLARRLLERGVRFVQLFHRGWDHHANLESRLAGKCRETDQASAALVADLSQRGLLEDTLVVWAGEFGRTAFCQGSINDPDYGRDHHPRCFSAWLAGGGIKRGHTHGRTDDFSFNVDEGGVQIWDLHATLLHCLGIDHTRLTFRFQGRDHRLTDVGGEVVHPLLS